MRDAIAFSDRPLSAFIQDSDRAGSKFFPRYFQQLFDGNMQHDAMNIVASVDDAEAPALLQVINLGAYSRVSRALGHSAGGGFCVYDGLDRDKWEVVRSRGGKLVLDMAIESFFPRDEALLGLFEGADEYGLDPADILILNSNRRASATFQAKRTALGLSSGPRFIDINACYWLIKGHNRLDDATRSRLARRMALAEAARSTTRAKKFVSFNGRLRRHRLFIVLWLLANGHLGDGHVSLLGYAKDKPAETAAAAKMIARYPGADGLAPYIPELLALMPLDLDVGLDDSQRDAAYINSLPWLSPAPHFYDESYFSIIVDTSFDDPDTLFLTPIAYKSFMNFSPFVYFGNHGALAELRSLGFQTFAPLIDESYDQIEDHAGRLAAGLVEVARLLKMTKAELSDMHEALWPRLVHNFNMFHALDGGRFADEIVTPLARAVKI